MIECATAIYSNAGILVIPLVQSVHGMMNNLMGSLGMLLAGMVIADVSLKNVFLRKRNYLSAALRLLIYPVLVLAVMKILSLFAPVGDFKQILLTVYLASVTPACTTVTPWHSSMIRTPLTPVLCMC